MKLWNGACHVHEQFSVEKLAELKRAAWPAFLASPYLEIADFSRGNFPEGLNFVKKTTDMPISR